MAARSLSSSTPNGIPAVRCPAPINFARDRSNASMRYWKLRRDEVEGVDRDGEWRGIGEPLVEAVEKTVQFHLGPGVTSHRRPCTDPDPTRRRTLPRKPSAQLGRRTWAGGSLEPRIQRRSSGAGTLCSRQVGGRSGRTGSLRGGNRLAVSGRGRGERFPGLLGHRLRRPSGHERPGHVGAMADCARECRRCRHACAVCRQTQRQTSRTGRQSQYGYDGPVRAHRSLVGLADGREWHFGRHVSPGLPSAPAGRLRLGTQHQAAGGLSEPCPLPGLGDPRNSAIAADEVEDLGLLQLQLRANSPINFNSLRRLPSMARAHAAWFRSECLDVLDLVTVVQPADHQGQGGHERDLLRSRLHAHDSFRLLFLPITNRIAETSGSGAPIDLLHGNKGGSANCC